MEMVEKEAENQPEISYKRIKSEEILDSVDRISLLPDCLLVEILSRLPFTKDVIKTGTLSKRWIHIWTLIPTLIFRMYPRSDFFSLVDQTLTQCRQINLNQFSVDTTYQIQFESKVRNWIRFAINRNVKHLELRLRNSRRLDITSKSVKNFVLSGYSDPEDEVCDLADVIEINAPNILSLTIQYESLLWKITLLDVSSLVKAKLDYEKLGHCETTPKQAKQEMFKEFILKLRHVKDLEIGNFCFGAFLRLKAAGFIFPSNLKYLYSLAIADSLVWSDSDSDESGD